MDIKTFLVSATPSLQEYPIEEVALAIDGEQTGPTFLDEIGDDLSAAMDLAKRYKLVNTPIEKAAREAQAVVVNILAYHSEKGDPEGRLRSLSNILNSAKVLHDIAKDVRAAVRELRK